MNTYDLGDLVRCNGPFTNTAGAAFDPTAVFFQVKDPEGTLTEYEYGTDAQLVKASTGNYYVDVNANKPGTWHYRFYATGSGQSSAEHSFIVAESEFD